MHTVASFADWVRQRRQLLGLTQAALAQQVGCALVTIKKIEQEARHPSREMAAVLADRLAIPAAQRDTSFALRPASTSKRRSRRSISLRYRRPRRRQIARPSGRHSSRVNTNWPSSKRI